MLCVGVVLVVVVVVVVEGGGEEKERETNRTIWDCFIRHSE